MELQLETRKCGNQRCTRTFRVLHESKQKYCSSSCANGIFGVAPFRARGKEDEDKPGEADLDMSESAGPERSSAAANEPRVEDVSPDARAANQAESEMDDGADMNLDVDEDEDEDFEASPSESRREF